MTSSRAAATCARTAFLLGFLLSPSTATAQRPVREPGIQDNSFLIEESYNQEEGVVQNIQTFQRDGDGGWIATFTQEWPLPAQTHQLSYTLVGARNPPQEGGSAGLGDLALNYRYQLVGSGESVVAVAPRISLVLPTGSWRAGRGSGGVALQALVPLSIAASRRIVVHGNAGFTWIPAARNPRGDRAGSLGSVVGGSVVWLARDAANLLVEAIWARTGVVEAPHRVSYDESLLVSPGARFAINTRDGLQIVPGIAFPIGVGPSRGSWSVFAYLSFEHPFRQPQP